MSKPARRSSDDVGPRRVDRRREPGPTNGLAAPFLEQVSLQANAAPARTARLRRECAGLLSAAAVLPDDSDFDHAASTSSGTGLISRSSRNTSDWPGPPIKLTTTRLDIGAIKRTGRRDDDPEDTRQPLDRRHHVHELELLPAVRLVEDRARDQHERRGLGVRVDVRGKHDPTEELGTPPVGPDEHAHAQVVADGNPRRGVADEELASARRTRIESAPRAGRRGPPAVTGPEPAS